MCSFCFHRRTNASGCQPFVVVGVPCGLNLMHPFHFELICFGRVQELLNSSCEVSVQDSNGQEPLHVAAAEGHSDLVLEL